MSFNLITTLVPWIALFVIFIASKKNFTLPDAPLSKKAKVFLIMALLLVVGLNAAILGTAYYKAYHPNNNYTKISQQVAFHIYQPTVLPEGFEQATKFALGKVALGKDAHPVTTAYDLPITALLRGGKPRLLILRQTSVPSGFDIQQNMLLNSKGDTPPVLQPIGLSSFPNQPVFLQTSGAATFIHLITPDNVYVLLGSVGESSEFLQPVANSLK